MTWTWGAIKGVFYRPRAVLREWRERDPEPGPLLVRFTIPVIVLSVVASAMAYDVLPAGFPPETQPRMVPFSIYSALTQLVGVLALAAAAHYLCDLFQGRSDFRRALAAVSVAMVPAWVGNVLAALPWPYGSTLALVCIGYSLILLYAAFVVILGMERGNRAGHYAASLGAGLLVVFAFGWQAVSLIPGAAPEVRLGTTWLI
ncbi:Yip1 family protein [Aquisalimonas sp.]|uniref:Yip1 family protein n=1 Tax=unclassified Aquisalimonas TaxID=2644645 RepID=UPI0025C002AA|nr:Yip1 family protein [Aquisalimonas sp.]